MIKVHQNNTWEDILNHTGNTIKVVYFGAKWCGPCKTLQPKIENIHMKNKDSMLLYIVDIDLCDDLCNKMNITSVPTVIILKNNKELNRVIGNNFEEFVNILDNA